MKKERKLRENKRGKRGESRGNGKKKLNQDKEKKERWKKEIKKERTVSLILPVWKDQTRYIKLGTRRSSETNTEQMKFSYSLVGNTLGFWDPDRLPIQGSKSWARSYLMSNPVYTSR